VRQLTPEQRFHLFSGVAVAASGGKICAFGGELANGGPSDAIQEVDPRKGAAHVIGHLPQPISHAAAVELGSHVYLLGGDPQRGEIRQGAERLIQAYFERKVVQSVNAHPVGGGHRGDGLVQRELRRGFDRDLCRSARC